MTTMIENRSKKEIYGIIGVGILGFVVAIFFLLKNRSGEEKKDTISDNEKLEINNIIEGNLSLPTSCKESLTIIDCEIQAHTGETEALSLYRQQITSERNITNKTFLEKKCKDQLSYLQSLTGLQSQCTSLSSL